MSVEISVIACVSENRLLPLLQALENQRFDKAAFECIFVVNDSAKCPQELWRSLKSKISTSIVRSHSVLGCQVSRNQGWRAARGDLIAFLDKDMLPTPGWLSAFRQAFDRYAPAVATGVCHCDGSLHQPGCLRVPNSELRFGIASSSDCNTPVRHSPPDPFWIKATSISFANAMMTKAILTETNGFAPLLRRVGDLEFAFRLKLAKAKIMHAPNAVAIQRRREGDSAESTSGIELESIFYRYPFQSATKYFLSQINASEQTLPGQRADPCVPSELHHLVQRLPRDQKVRTFAYKLPDLIDYFGAESGLPVGAVSAYLAKAIAAGLLVVREKDAVFLDLYHTTNWLRTMSRYREHCLKHASYARINPTPVLRKDAGASPAHFHCEGHYRCGFRTVEIPQLGAASLNLTLPIPHRNQGNVRIKHLDPPILREFMDEQNGLLTGIPCSLVTRNGGQVSYDFECDIREGILLADRQPDAGSQKDAEPMYLRFTFPPERLKKTESLLDNILEGGASDAEADVRRIYAWIITNLSHASTPMRDHSVLDTGIGTCVQLTRLFINLVRLRGVPAREQCGALMVRRGATGKIDTVTLEYSPFAHTWAEVQLEGRDWCPVDFMVMRYSKREVTPYNVGRETEAELQEQTPRLVDYYFGNIDPYRIYTNSYANRISPISIAKGRVDPVSYGVMLSQLQYHLSCSIVAC
jgi:GT2 family glycosyltransferase